MNTLKAAVAGERFACLWIARKAFIVDRIGKVLGADKAMVMVDVNQKIAIRI